VVGIAILPGSCSAHLGVTPTADSAAVIDPGGLARPLKSTKPPAAAIATRSKASQPAYG
jgi:hypothetical protein